MYVDLMIIVEMLVILTLISWYFGMSVARTCNARAGAKKVCKQGSRTVFAQALPGSGHVAGRSSTIAEHVDLCMIGHVKTVSSVLKSSQVVSYSLVDAFQHCNVHVLCCSAADASLSLARRDIASLSCSVSLLFSSACPVCMFDVCMSSTTCKSISCLRLRFGRLGVRGIIHFI
jgi:hypothetical protein